jgi:hypothetical protein
VGRILGAAAALTAIAATAWATPAGSPDTGTWGTDGRVWAITRLGNTVFIGGAFSNAVAPDGTTTPRSNLMAIDATTGQLVDSFDPEPNGTVYALATDGNQVFVGGAFNTIAGASRSRLAGFDASGALEPWTADLTGGAGVTGRSLTVSGSTLYVGGKFTQVQGKKHLRLASLDISSGTPAVQSWNPKVNNGEVRGIAPLATGQVVIGGNFTTVGGVDNANLAVINADGTPGAWASHPTSQVWDVAGSGSTAYAAIGGLGVPDGIAAAYTSDGNVVWSDGTDGAAQAVQLDPADGELIVGGHFVHFTGLTFKRLVAVDPATGALDTSWKPNPNSSKGVWSIYASPDKLYVGGDFTTIGGASLNRFAQFSTGS